MTTETINLTTSNNHNRTMFSCRVAVRAIVARHNGSALSTAAVSPVQILHQRQPPRILRSFRRSITKSKAAADKVSVTFIKPDGAQATAETKVGENLLDVIIDNDIDIDGFGACEGTLACSTCHLIFKQEDFDRLPDEATDEELDMLDLAYGLEDTSRLGCQVCMTKELDGLVVKVPEGVNDQR